MPGSAPGAPRRLAGEADRERLVALLREHYALGQLDDDELDRRVGVVLGARYMDEAASAVTDLPQLAAPGAAAGRPARQRRGHPVTITIDGEHPGPVVPDDFAGLSFERGPLNPRATPVCRKQLVQPGK